MSNPETDTKLTAEVANWNIDFEKNSASRPGDKKAVYMKFDTKGDYHVRFVGNFVKFLRHSEPFGKQRVITHPSYGSQDPAWNAGFIPRETYAIHVIDRRDGQLKILEKGNAIFKLVGKYKKLTNTDPSGKVAPDFVISVNWSGDNKLTTKYEVMAMPTTNELTEEEIALFRKNVIKLDEMYKSTSLEKINELWNNLPADVKVPKPKDKDFGGQKAQGSQAAPQAAPQVVRQSAPIVERNAPQIVSADDLFGGSNTDF